MNNVQQLLEALPLIPEHHKHQSPIYQYLANNFAEVIQNSSFAREAAVAESFGEFGDVTLPYYSMGNIDSLHLFGMDEMILFAFYWQNRNRYKKVADMGANIGLHSILMSKLGWQVSSFEPDPIHVAKIQQHIELNSCKNITIHQNAIADKTQDVLFTRLLGNRTGSHIKGSKENVYGELDEFSVKCLPLSTLMAEFDFIKMDIEGAEASAICNTTEADWLSTDLMVEIGSKENAAKIWAHAKSIGLKVFTQKTGWRIASSLCDLPVHHTEGSVFLTKASCKECIFKNETFKP